MRTRLMFVAVLLAVATLQAWADVVIEETTTDSSGTLIENVTIYATPNRVAIKQGNSGMIFFADKQLAWQYDTERSMYIELTPDTMKALREKTDSVVAEQMKALKEQMDTMPPEQKDAIQKAIDQLQQGDNYSFKRLGPDRTVGQWKCTPIQVIVNGEESEQMCAAPLSDVGLSESDMKVFDTLEKFYANLGKGRSSQIFNLPGLEKFVGFRSFPVEEITIGASGEKEISRVKSIKHQTAPESAFVLPEGLTKQSLLGMQ